MDKVVQSFQMSRLPNDTHAEFHETILAHLIATGVETHGMEKLLAVYVEKFANEKEALDFYRAGEYTERLREQDAERSMLFRGCAQAVEGYMSHFDPAIRADANVVFKLVKFHSSLTRKGADARSAGIDDFLRDMTSATHVEVVKRLKIDEWLVKIGEANVAYRRLAMLRYDETTLRTPYRMKTCRPETDRLYRGMVNEIENRMLTGGKSPEVAEFIAKWNVIVGHFKSKLPNSQNKDGKEKTPDAS